MRPLHRRALLAAAAVGLGAGVSGAAQAQARPFFRRHGLPIGIQLYTLGPEAARDLEGTLAAVAGIGFRTVELAGFYGRSPQDLRAALDKAGLKATSAHIQPRGAPGASFEGDVGKVAEALNVVGATHAVMPIPRIPERLGLVPAAGEDFVGYLRRVFSQMTADDWRANAQFLNEKGAALARSGIRVGYHNHNMEFAPLGGVSGMEILLAETDPKLVTFEADVGWIAASGQDPADLLTRHKGRFTLMHVKDLKASTQPNFTLAMDPSDIGAGRIEWKRLLPAAHAAGVRHFFLEQEPPFPGPRIDSARAGHDFLAGLVA